MRKDRVPSWWYTKEDFNAAVQVMGNALHKHVAEMNLAGVVCTPTEYNEACLYATYMRTTTEWDVSEAVALERVAQMIKESGEVPKIPTLQDLQD